MKRTLRLSFLTDTGAKAGISVPHGKPAYDGADIKAAMERIIAADAVRLKSGRLAVVAGARLICVTDTEYQL